jgi:hypothetical protein
MGVETVIRSQYIEYDVSAFIFPFWGMGLASLERVEARMVRPD